MLQPETGLTFLKETDVYMYNDLDPDQQKHWASLVYGQTLIAEESQTKEAYLHYPTTFLYGGKDMAMPLELQKAYGELGERAHSDQRSSL